MAAKTIEEMKVGDLLEFGRYSVLPDNENPPPIIWIKMTPNTSFISKYVLDYLVFDQEEPADYLSSRCNPNYDESNISQFLNSCAEKSEWFRPLTENDVPPRTRRPWEVQTGYVDHEGFLNHFADNEIDAIADDIRLPMAGEIKPYDSVEVAKYFNRHGVRTNPTADFIDNKRMPFLDTSFVEYYTQTRISPSSSTVAVIDRSGQIRSQLPNTSSGIRPVCTLSGESKVELCNDGVYRLIDTSFKYKPKSIKTLFGI